MYVYVEYKNNFPPKDLLSMVGWIQKVNVY